MKHIVKYYTIFGQAYGEGNYGNCSYNQNSTQCTPTTGGGTSGSGNGSGLANTGFDIVLILTLACVLVFASIIVRVWRRKPAQQEVTTEDVSEADEKRLADRF